MVRNPSGKGTWTNSGCVPGNPVFQAGPPAGKLGAQRPAVEGILEGDEVRPRGLSLRRIAYVNASLIAHSVASEPVESRNTFSSGGGASAASFSTSSIRGSFAKQYVWYSPVSSCRRIASFTRGCP